MKAIADRFMGKLVHSSFIQEVLRYKERRDLDKLTNAVYSVNNLRYLTERDLHTIFVDTNNEAEWGKVTRLIEGLELPEMMGGVNKGDQRAIFYLINSFKPDNVLEIGTHIGCSTVHIALALSKNATSHLTTVDLIDVNDPVHKHWARFNSKHAPSKLMDMVKRRARVSFVKDDSIHFLNTCRQKFDFVFLDGSHKAKMVFQEVPLAMQLLNKNGILLLHDYFPRNEPIWENVATIPGPYLAISKIINKEDNIAVVPLGELPWKTKINSCYTSLAILTKKY